MSLWEALCKELSEMVFVLTFFLLKRRFFFKEQKFTERIQIQRQGIICHGPPIGMAASGPKEEGNLSYGNGAVRL